LPPDHNRLAAALTAGGAAFLYLVPSITAGVPALRPVFGVRDRTASGEGVALTFDDGPHPEGTPAVLEVLANAGATATFFLVGEQVERRPGLAAEIVAAGHEVALHCHRHRSLLRLGPRAVRDDLGRAFETIFAATGVEPRLYRPPHGVLNTAALAYARLRGWQTVLWTREGHDWQARATPESIASRVTRRVRVGDVLLLHDADYYSAPGSWRNTLAALPLVLDRLDRRGQRPTPVGTS
jgi:peptidoglycan/xylan/chitin deacetylase (PgdA/CDA1 family)